MESSGDQSSITDTNGASWFTGNNHYTRCNSTIIQNHEIKPWLCYYNPAVCYEGSNTSNKCNRLIAC